MFDIGWGEILVVAVIALVVIGPKELPVVLRTLGRWTRRIRLMASQVQGQVDTLIREAELEEVRDTLKAARPSNVARALDRTIDPDGSIARTFQNPPAWSGEPVSPTSAVPSADASPAALAAPGASAPPVGEGRATPAASGLTSGSASGSPVSEASEPSASGGTSAPGRPAAPENAGAAPLPSRDTEPGA
ncbi:twin-arginine translocase subunit TatB [Phaeovibrio sulfidiphilus]|uniref:Sec-independent protein translocase protein TatB n=1 Tax=Phaeovibrio sulfidiphilus TaxID=1220600 RepID=A0A8J6YKM8_9PROT|nr:Sec-independent protein translocase protein TatB [Phaeovibrio sulfidiphilus]MBE1236163.1 twin-arginine translocase subunit TatB [Phaeovibrio sulfidiphilus]